jgi:plasmid stabilization system protein ParE
MPAYQVDLSSHAIDQLNQIIEYLDGQKTGLGQDFAIELVELILRLEQNPLIYQKVDTSVHKGQLGKFRHLAFYQVKGTVVEILEIVHGSQNTKYLK